MLHLVESVLNSLLFWRVVSLVLSIFLLIGSLNYNRFRAWALTDHLTKLWNRRFFEKALDQELRKARHFTAVVLLDLDKFKQINDTLGHPAGDKVLRLVAGRIRSQLRKQDVAARIGGDEFAVILPGTSQEDAERVASKLRKAISHRSGKTAKVTASTGVFVVARGNTSARRLLKAADVAMYESKNRRESVDEGPPSA